jgi:aminopeptidase-like protein
MPRSLTGEGIDTSFKVFQAIHPEFHTLSFATGTEVFDWIIPPVWNVKNAYIEHESGQRFCEFLVNNLHLVGYSEPVDILLDKEELLKFLHSRDDLPEAIPYVTSYYVKRWGFCISRRQLHELPEGNYRCFIDSSFTTGSLNLIEAVLPGESSEEVFFSSYLCHPSMANNELSGPVLLSAIMTHLKQMDNRKLTYRFVLLPETIGSIAYLSSRVDELKENVIAGFNLSCVGDERRYTHLLSRKGNCLADQALSAALLGRENVITKSFAHRGSDERQYNSPGIELPVCGFSRSKFGDYPEYHTSLDNFDVVTEIGLRQSFEVMKDLVDAFECGLFPLTKILCEPQLGKRGLYPTLSECVASITDERLVDDLSIRMDALAYSDGETNIFEMTKAAGCTLRKMISEVQKLSAHNLIEDSGKSWLK